MKTTIAFFILVFSLGAFAQVNKVVTSNLIDLGNLRGKNKIVLKFTPQSPEKIKLLFNYQYRFTSEDITAVYPGASGGLEFSTQTSYSEMYETKQKVILDISESSVVSKGEDLLVIVNITKPNPDSTWINVDVSLQDAKGNIVSGGRKLLGLLGRSYKIKEVDCN